ncbi:cytochrome P450 [Phellopilus nigrolimitatus]|nr:cytochrome P450 [Phellopilus nigrolimitatus]
MGLTLDLTAVTIALIWIGTLAKKRRQNYPYPPGPKGLPIIGNYLISPKSLEWEKAAEWGRTYGDLVFIDNLGTKILYINSYAAAVELLEKRSKLYSSRPWSVFLNELEGFDYIVTTMPYNERVRRQRKFFHRFFNADAVSNYKPLQLREAHKMLLRIQDTPDDVYTHVRLVNTHDDPLLTLANVADVAFGEGVGLKYLVDYIPWLRYIPEWFPGAGRKLKLYHEGTAVPSFTSQLIEANSDEYENIRHEEDIAGAAAAISTAGSDSNASPALTFILQAVLNPEMQKRGQEEIDAVVGRDTLPTFDDRENLPYVNAICKECLRWEALVPLGTAHSTDVDDHYNGYFIPAGTVVVPNQWAMLRDPREYASPEIFMPERWMPSNGTTIPLNPNKIAFGFGRRICPGMLLAENTLFIAIASLLACFDFNKATDSNGPITPTCEYIDSAFRGPKPFKCRVSPRSETVPGLIRAVVEAEATT